MLVHRAQRYFDELLPKPTPAPPAAVALSVLALLLREQSVERQRQANTAGPLSHARVPARAHANTLGMPDAGSPWGSGDWFRTNLPHRTSLTVELEGETLQVPVTVVGGGKFDLQVRAARHLPTLHAPHLHGQIRGNTVRASGRLEDDGSLTALVDDSKFAATAVMTGTSALHLFSGEHFASA